jgi:hypothetical protein
MNLAQMKARAVLLDKHKKKIPAEIMELIDAETNWKPRMGQLLRDGEPRAAGGLYYQDTRLPFNIADFSAVTLAATNKQLWLAAEYTPTYKNDWSPGKTFHLKAFGKMTTAATPGNLTVAVYYGTADALTTLLATSAALTLIASQTNISWRYEGYTTCRAVGASGSLIHTGILEIGTAVVAAGQALVPASAAAAVTCDLTATSGISLQMARSGSTAETATAQTLTFAAMN